MTQHYVGTKIVLAWEQTGGPKVRVCGHTCHAGGEHCNGYCSGKVDHPPLLDPQPGFTVKYADGYTSWSPEQAFTEAYLPLGHIGHLPPHQQRMVAELAVLERRLEGLAAFLGTKTYQALDEVEQTLLTDQKLGMSMYRDCLKMRCERFLEATADAVE